MQHLTSVKQLTPNIGIRILDHNGNFRSYSFLCIHPEYKNYILAIDSMTLDAPKLYLPFLIGNENVYVGDFDRNLASTKIIECYQHKIELVKKRMRPIQ